MKHLTELHLPFTGQWLTFWGGDTKELNQHHDSTAQKYAFDFVKVDENEKFHSSDGKSNTDYYSFGQDVLAPGDGVVIEAVDGVIDNEPGDTNPYSLTGNHIIIKHNNGEYSLLAHLRNGSVTIHQGDTVTSGQKIGECGNSGNSSSSHLHYHLQSSNVFARLDEDYNQQDVAGGVKITFSGVRVVKDSNERTEENYSPVKGDYVSSL